MPWGVGESWEIMIWGSHPPFPFIFSHCENKSWREPGPFLSNRRGGEREKKKNEKKEMFKEIKEKDKDQTLEEMGGNQSKNTQRRSLREWKQNRLKPNKVIERFQLFFCVLGCVKY